MVTRVGPRTFARSITHPGWRRRNRRVRHVHGAGDLSPPTDPVGGSRKKELAFVASHRRPKQPSRTRVTVLTATAAAAVALSSQAAHADPKPTKNEVKAKVDKLYHEAGAATEQYNGAKEKQEKLEKQIGAIQDKVARGRGAQPAPLRPRFPRRRAVPLRRHRPLRTALPLLRPGQLPRPGVRPRPADGQAGRGPVEGPGEAAGPRAAAQGGPGQAGRPRLRPQDAR